MALDVTHRRARAEQAAPFVLSSKTLAEQFSEEHKRGFLGPIAALFREQVIIKGEGISHDVANMVGFLMLFPSIGSVYEEQSAVEKLLEERGWQASFIEMSLRNKVFPKSWRYIWTFLGEARKETDEAVAHGLQCLEYNNLPVIERGLRKREFEAVTYVVTERSGPGLPEMMKDGEFYFGALHGKETEKRWRRVITERLTQLYMLKAQNRENFALQGHIALIAELPRGALYAYAQILALVYPLPKKDKKAPEVYAGNGEEWVEGSYCSEICPKLI